MFPAEDGNSPRTAWITELLPAPTEPTMATSWPGNVVRLTFSRVFSSSCLLHFPVMFFRLTVGWLGSSLPSFFSTNSSLVWSSLS